MLLDYSSAILPSSGIAPIKVTAISARGSSLRICVGYVPSGISEPAPHRSFLPSVLPKTLPGPRGGQTDASASERPCGEVRGLIPLANLNGDDISFVACGSRRQLLRKDWPWFATFTPRKLSTQGSW